MQQKTGELSITTRGSGAFEITRDISGWVHDTGLRDGLLTIFLQHTSASLVIQENADSDVMADLVDALERLASRNADYRHTMEGPDDMPAHIKAAITPVSLQIPVKGGRMMLGTWQGIFVLEHRDAPHTRKIVLHLMGT